MRSQDAGVRPASDMNGWLPDRTVLFELGKSCPTPQVKSWSDAQPREVFFLSAATIAAIRHRAERRCDAALRTEVTIWLDHVLRPWFAGRILPVTEDIVLERRRILARRCPVGTGHAPPDILLLATARTHRLTLCTRDHRAYLGMGAQVFNPWSP